MIIRKTVLLFTLCVVMALSACLTFDVGSPNPDKRVTSAIKLKAAKDIFIATATSAKRLCEQEILSEDDCETAQIAYMQGKEALVSAYEIWDVLGDLDHFDGNAVFSVNSGDPVSYNDLIKSAVKFTTIIETLIRKAD